MIDAKTLLLQAQAMKAEMTKIFRELHRHPELGGAEKWTQAYLIDRLREMGLQAQTYPGMTCVTALIEGAQPGPCVGVRADMDALPVQEKSGAAYASEIPGCMHACGHDAHMTIALGMAKLLILHRDELRGSVKLLFEHAEETTGGATEMIAAGCMENPHIDCMLGLHMLPSQPVGTLLTKAGAVSGSSTSITITVKGAGCHGAYPERGVDAILIASQVICALQSVVSRNVSPLDSAVVSLGKITGGTAGNVVCNQVEIIGTLRALDNETREMCKQRITSICKGVAQGMGGDAQVEFVPGYGALVNDPALHERFERAARRLLGDAGIKLREAPSLGVESFAFFVENVPGVYYDLGCGEGSALHACDFRVDEDCLPIGAALQAATVFEFLND